MPGPTSSVPGSSGSRSSVGPDLTKFLDKSLSIKLHGNRAITGILRGFDAFMNLVLEDAQENGKKGETGEFLGTVVIRGNSVLLMEALEKVA